MQKPNSTTRAAPLWAALAIPVAWLALIAGSCAGAGKNLARWLSDFMQAVNKPLEIHWTEYSGKALLVTTLLYGLAIAAYYSSKGNRRPGEEHGSAKWGNAKQLNAMYVDKKLIDQNLILTKHVMIGLDGRKHRHNLNVLVVGGSGSGKTRFYAMPNLMQGNSSFIITDPKGEMLRCVTPLLIEKGYDVKTLNLINPELSDGYNPFCYLHDDKDAIKLITNLIKNTTPKGASASDPFWEKAEIALDTALILYLMHQAPEDEQNFETMMYMIENGAAKEEDEEYRSPLDLLFEVLEEEDPNHIAVKQYKIFKQASGKTAKSILISAAVRLAAFSLAEIANITSRDDLDMSSMGERKRAVFAVIPDNDSSFNYLVGMLYTQAFQELYYRADHLHGGRLPVHVQLIMDEFANVALPDDFEKILSTMRSREISVSIIIQNMAQLKALFKDSWENITGNCDTFIYLGGNEQSTHEYISKMLGKETIDTRTSGLTRGRSGSSSINYQNAGRELLTLDEVRLLDNSDALLFIRGERPVIDKKYDIMKHPNVKHTENGGAAPYIHNKCEQHYQFDDLQFLFTSLDDIEILEVEELIDEKTE